MLTAKEKKYKMKAFVINEDQIKNTVMLLIGALLTVFILGYYLGSQSSSTVDIPKQTDQHTVLKKDIKLPESEAVQINEATKSESKTGEEKRLQKEKAIAAKKEAEKKEQARKEQARKAALKKEAAKKEAAKKELARKQAAKKEAAKKEAAKKEAAKKEAAKKELARKEAAKKEAAKKEDKSAQSNSNEVVNNVSETESDITKLQIPVDLDEADLEKKVYSIQAGMFASEANANSFIDKLSAKKFDAYVSSFMSSSGTTKYNVRVGRFAEREQARLLLKEFQKSFSSPAYVVITR